MTTLNKLLCSFPLINFPTSYSKFCEQDLRLINLVKKEIDNLSTF